MATLRLCHYNPLVHQLLGSCLVRLFLRFHNPMILFFCLPPRMVKLLRLVTTHIRGQRAGGAGAGSGNNIKRLQPLGITLVTIFRRPPLIILGAEYPCLIITIGRNGHIEQSHRFKLVKKWKTEHSSFSVASSLKNEAGHESMICHFQAH